MNYKAAPTGKQLFSAGVNFLMEVAPKAQGVFCGAVSSAPWRRV